MVTTAIESSFPAKLRDHEGFHPRFQLRAVRGYASPGAMT